MEAFRHQLVINWSISCADWYDRIAPAPLTSRWPAWSVPLLAIIPLVRRSRGALRRGRRRRGGNRPAQGRTGRGLTRRGLTRGSLTRGGLSGGSLTRHNGRDRGRDGRVEDRAADPRRAAIEQRQCQRQHHEHRGKHRGGSGQQIGGASPGHERPHPLGAADPEAAALAALDQHDADQSQGDEQVYDQQYSAQRAGLPRNIAAVWGATCASYPSGAVAATCPLDPCHAPGRETLTRRRQQRRQPYVTRRAILAGRKRASSARAGTTRKSALATQPAHDRVHLNGQPRWCSNYGSNQNLPCGNFEKNSPSSTLRCFPAQVCGNGRASRGDDRASRTAAQTRPPERSEYPSDVVVVGGDVWRTPSTGMGGAVASRAVDPRRGKPRLFRRRCFCAPSRVGSVVRQPPPAQCHCRNARTAISAVPTKAPSF